MTPEAKLDAVSEILWPAADPGEQWTSNTLNRVADVVGGYRPRGKTPAAKAVREIVELLYPKAEPDRAWSADTIEDVGWVVEAYNNTQGKFGGMSVDEIAAMSRGNPQGGLVRGVVTIALTALGVTGIVMGIRQAKAAVK